MRRRKSFVRRANNGSVVCHVGRRKSEKGALSRWRCLLWRILRQEQDSCKFRAISTAVQRTIATLAAIVAVSIVGGWSVGKSSGKSCLVQASMCELHAFGRVAGQKVNSFAGNIWKRTTLPRCHELRTTNTPFLAFAKHPPFSHVQVSPAHTSTHKQTPRFRAMQHR